MCEWTLVDPPLSKFTPDHPTQEADGPLKFSKESTLNDHGISMISLTIAFFLWWHLHVLNPNLTV